LPALGTDSLASNPTLSLWREMRLLAEAHPTVMPSEIFKMATLGGAEALGLERRFGALEPGKEADLLAVPIPDNLKNAEQIYHFLVYDAGSLLQPARIPQ
jgi:cytosine/adenosine deaminase-related metal-dependent hydrolase